MWVLPKDLPSLGAWALTIATIWLIFRSQNRWPAIKLGIFGGFAIGGAVVGTIGVWTSGTSDTLAAKSSEWTAHLFGTGIGGAVFILIYYVLKAFSQKSGRTTPSLATAAGGPRRRGSRTASSAAGGTGGRGRSAGVPLGTILFGFALFALAILFGGGLAMIPKVWDIANFCISWFLVNIIGGGFGVLGNIVS